ncbi:hypothetical protein GWK47_019320 [Chionoecetes opilio]|uniref:Uncharacterized protein n=1 Tax=Chionoecetes opilio TaxID=41210 RepID=A0A8J4XQE9_CHIOP|nr:hypothetical protein GWK47_019320 [Chionoecetes opilio]
MVCNYTQRGPPIFLSSKVSVAVREAMTQFRSPVAPQPLPMAPSRLFNDLQDLTEAVRLFDFTKPPNITALDQMVNTTRREVDRLLKGLTAMMEDWPFAVVDAGVQKGPEEVRMVIRQTDATLSLLLRGLPSSSGTNNYLYL